LITPSIDVDPAEFERATGWTLTPEGACRGDVCVILAGRTLPDLAERLQMPLVHDAEAGLWSLGPRVERVLEAGGRAPDFELPDLAGRPHRLSDQRGRKVLILAWAPW
jgi:AhpC/TSA family